MVFVPAFLSLFPGQLRWLQVIPIEGLLGRVVGDALIHYLNLAGAYIVCATVLAVALYLSTAFSFSSMQLWIPTRFAFVLALRDRWRLARGSRQAQDAEGTRQAPRSQAGGDSPIDSGRPARQQGKSSPNLVPLTPRARPPAPATPLAREDWHRSHGL